MRWLENDDGDELYEDYCVDRAVNESHRQRNLKRRSRGKDGGFTRVSGWDTSQEEDAQRYCEKCGMLLICSITDYGIEQEIEYIKEADSLSASDCWTISRLLSGSGCHSDDKYWQQIAGHAERLMKASLK